MAGIEARSPWWPYPAIRRVESLLGTAWSVLEFGVGASTAWLARRARTAVRVVRPGGHVYVDNSDVPDIDHRSAVATLLEAAAGVERFIGLCPGTVAVNQGLLIRLPTG